jgi:hypothetical protein
MNRYRSNWSAMGSGETNSSYLKVKSVEECKKHILELFNPCNFEDSWRNVIDALHEIKKSSTF